MLDFIELLVLGTVAGFTIFLGLPVVFFGVSERIKGFLNAVAVGILIFLIVDIFSHAWDMTSEAAVAAFQGGGSVIYASVDLALMFGGLTAGLLGLVVYEGRYTGKKPDGLGGHRLSTLIAPGR